MNVIYTSSDGKSYPLTLSFSLRLKTANFHNFAWKPEVTSRRYGERVSLWGKDVAKYPASIVFRGTHAQRREALDEFHSSVERDVFYNTPGRLTWGGWYIACFVSSSETYPSENDLISTINDLEIYCPHPFWISEQDYSIAPISSHALRPTDKQYNLQYGYTYSYQVTQNTSRQILLIIMRRAISVLCCMARRTTSTLPSATCICLSITSFPPTVIWLSIQDRIFRQINIAIWLLMASRQTVLISAIPRRHYSKK